MIQVNIGSMELTANHNIQQIVEVCSDFEKRGKLERHLDKISSENAKVLIFVGTKRVADDITKYLREEGMAGAGHSWRQGTVSFIFLLVISLAKILSFFRRERDWVLGEFKAGRFTDSHSHGCRISWAWYVFHFHKRYRETLGR